MRNFALLICYLSFVTLKEVKVLHLKVVSGGLTRFSSGYFVVLMAAGSLIASKGFYLEQVSVTLAKRLLAELLQGAGAQVVAARKHLVYF